MEGARRTSDQAIRLYQRKCANALFDRAILCISLSSGWPPTLLASRISEAKASFMSTCGHAKVNQPAQGQGDLATATDLERHR